MYGHVWVEDYVHRGVEKLRNWNPVLIKIVFLISTPYSVLFHADPLRGICNQIEVSFVLFALSPTSDVWIPDPLHHHHFSEECRGIHGLAQMIMCEQLCSSCCVFRIVNLQSVEKSLEFLADGRFIRSVSRIAYTSAPPD